MKRRLWRRVERTLCWYVFLHCTDGDVIPIIGFWLKRDAKRWVADHSDRHRMEVHRYGWRV